VRARDLAKAGVGQDGSDVRKIRGATEDFRHWASKKNGLLVEVMQAMLEELRGLFRTSVAGPKASE
jgi:hypothetical protein